MIVHTFQYTSFMGTPIADLNEAFNEHEDYGDWPWVPGTVYANITTGDQEAINVDSAQELGSWEAHSISIVLQKIYPLVI